MRLKKNKNKKRANKNRLDRPSRRARQKKPRIVPTRLRTNEKQPDIRL